MNKKILLWLIKNGFRYTNKGVQYLADAICIYNETKAPITTIYTMIAENYDILPHSVERCMRNAIHTTWQETTFVKYTKETPANSEAIYLLELIYFDGDEDENK